MTGTTYGSDVIVDLLADLEIDLIPFAPGATFRGIHDSLTQHVERTPEIIECLHEEISVAVAHGYAKATGRIAAVALHDVVGLQHACMAIYNAWCDRVPLLLLGGTGPVDAAKRRPWIDWIHTANVQATQVRDYTKWDDQPASLPAAVESIIRGTRLAQSTPRGPVYITIDSEVQEQVAPDDIRVPPSSTYAQPAGITAPTDVIARIVDLLVGAERPLVAVESVGRSQATLEDLVAIAEVLRAPVVEVERDYNRSELCFPTQHPLNLSGVSLPGAPDLVIALEVRDVSVIPGVADAPVIQVTTAPFAVKSWAADLQRIQPTDLLVHAEVTSILADVRAELERRSVRPRDGVWDLSAVATRARTAWRDQAEELPEGITPAFLAARLDEATRQHDRVLANGSLHNWVHRLWDIGSVDQYLGSSGGAGLGYGLGASVGVALAYRGTQRLVVDIQSDGDALMTPQALWTAAHHRVPLLVVVENNRRWGNSHMHAGRIATQRGRSLDHISVGTVIDDPAVDFVGLAKAFGIEQVFTVESPAELDDVLAAAVVATLRGEPTVVDVIMRNER